ncbi:hypothetical protein R6Q59_035451 [Mikania micrantha]|uniref:Protein kinase domain-containing protein n=1 Tax=Mikania micrantha TaxID=192012 RepID=A0A5N6NFD6_9ASTR|nr:hypothetical protein E3N88_23810 [Mikania micrantha]
MDPPSRQATQPNNQNQGIVATDPNETNEVGACNFGFRDLAMATKNFRRESLLGESRVGKLYKGTLRTTGQVVAVKQLDRHGTKANKEFLADVMMLSRLRHPNLVDLIGYCADGDQRILVYEYMEMGSVKNHLHEVPPEREPLDWITRMKIASGTAQALEYLHETTNPPILYRNFTSANILLNENMEPKLSDYGLVMLEIDAGNAMQQRIVCSVGCAPEYEQNGDVTNKSDVYSFGVVLLELITGRRALDTTRPVDEQNLVKWAQPYFKEPKRFPEMADPQLKGSFPDKSLNQAVGVAAMCVQDDPSVRPMISDVVAALSFLTVAPTLQSQSDSNTATVTATTAAIDGSTNDPSCSSSSSSIEANEELEASSSQNEGSEDYSCSESEDEDEQSPIRIKTNKTGYDEDKGGTSSSESLYNEDDYWEDESLQDETSYRSKSKPKSIKRKGTIGTDKRSVSRNSSNVNKSLKQHSRSSLRKKSVNKSSKNNERDHVSLSKKSGGLFGDDQNSCDPYTLKIDSGSRNNKSFKTQLGSNSSKKSVDRKSSKNSEKLDVSLNNKPQEDDQSSIKPYESNNKAFSRRYNNVSNVHSSSRRSTTTTVPKKSHSNRSKDEKLKKSESDESSISSDSGESRRRIVTSKSRRKDKGESDSSMNNTGVEILDGGEDINARLLEDTYVPI